MFKFKNKREPIPVDATHGLYLCVEFNDPEGRVVHKAVATAIELQQYFSGYGCGVSITGYMSQQEAQEMTEEERGLPIPILPPLVRPTNVPAHVWDHMDRKTQKFMIEHERLHEILRKALHTSDDIFAALLADNK